MHSSELVRILNSHASHQEHIPIGLVSDILGNDGRTGVAEYISRLPILVIDPSSSIAHRYPTAPIVLSNPEGNSPLAVSGTQTDVARGAITTATILEQCKILPTGEGFRRAARVVAQDGEPIFADHFTTDLSHLIRTTFRQPDRQVEAETSNTKPGRIANLRQRAAGILADHDAQNIASGLSIAGLDLTPSSLVHANDLPKPLQRYHGVDVKDISVSKDRAPAGKLHVCADCGLGIARGSWRLTIGLQDYDRSGRTHHHFHPTCAAKSIV